MLRNSYDVIKARYQFCDQVLHFEHKSDNWCIQRIAAEACKSYYPTYLKGLDYSRSWLPNNLSEKWLTESENIIFHPFDICYDIFGKSIIFMFQSIFEIINHLVKWTSSRFLFFSQFLHVIILSEDELKSSKQWNEAETNRWRILSFLRWRIASLSAMISSLYSWLASLTCMMLMA